MLKKIINALRGKRVSRTDHTLYWTAADLSATTDALHVTNGKGPRWKKTGPLFPTSGGNSSIEHFAGHPASVRENFLKIGLKQLAEDRVIKSYVREAQIQLSRMMDAHAEACARERLQAESNAEGDAVAMAIVRMLEIDKANLLEEQAMFTESEWKARAKAIDDGDIDIETLRQNELEASVAVPYTGEEDLKGLPYDVLQEMLAGYRRTAMVVGHVKATYRHEDYTVFISKDGVQVEHENVVQFA